MRRAGGRSRAGNRRRVEQAIAALVVALVYAAWSWSSGTSSPTPAESDAIGTAGDGAITAAFRDRRSDVIIESTGTVDRELADDRDGSRHQRFILRLATGQTLLVAHNIDLAPRVPLAVGDEVEFRGEYEWTDRGGVLHWTHHDPNGRRAGGWLRHRGRVYE